MRRIYIIPGYNLHKKSQRQPPAHNPGSIAARLETGTRSKRAKEYGDKWRGGSQEHGERRSFWSDFLTVFGIDR